MRQSTGLLLRPDCGALPDATSYRPCFSEDSETSGTPIVSLALDKQSHHIVGTGARGPADDHPFATETCPNPAHAHPHSKRLSSSRHLSRSDRATLVSRITSGPKLSLYGKHYEEVPGELLLIEC